MLRVSKDEIERNLLALTQASRAERAASKHAEREMAERTYMEIDEWLDKNDVSHFYSHKAKRYLYKRYRIIVDGHLETAEHIWDCHTLIDSETGEVVKHDATSLPVIMKEPMKSPALRREAEARCEAWNLVESGRCGKCGYLFQTSDYSESSEVSCKICFGCATSMES